MNIALLSKNKENFIDGTGSKLNFIDGIGLLYSSWIRCNTMVLSRIHLSINELIAWYVIWIEWVVGVCKNPKYLFSQSDIFKFMISQKKYTRLINKETLMFLITLQIWIFCRRSWKIIVMFLIASVLSNIVAILLHLYISTMTKTMLFTVKGSDHLNFNLPRNNLSREYHTSKNKNTT